MIRIETTAEFDAQGHFTVSGQTTEPIDAGSHRVVVILDEVAAKTPESPLKKIGNVLVYTGTVYEDAESARRRLDEERLREFVGPSLIPTVVDENGLALLNALPEFASNVDVQPLIDADREDRMRHLLGGEQP